MLAKYKSSIGWSSDLTNKQITHLSSKRLPGPQDIRIEQVENRKLDETDN